MTPPGTGVRVALIGAGSVAQRHAGVLTSLGATVAAVADPSTTAAERLAAPFGCPTFPSAEHALDAVDVDAVYVCVPPFAHGAPEDAALARGLPFFVEKPVALDITVGERIRHDVDEVGLTTGSGYHWRCLDTLRHARRVLADRPPALAAGSWLGGRPAVRWWSDRTLSGGQVVEQLTHVLDLALVLLGPALRVTAASARPAIDDDRAVDEATAATVEFASGTVATFAATCVLDARMDAALRIYGPGAVLRVAEESVDAIVDGASSSWGTGEDPRVAIDRDFLEVLCGVRAQTVAPYRDAIETHRLGCAIVEAAATGRAVDLGHGAPGRESGSPRTAVGESR